MPYVNCKICKTKFYAKPNWIRQGWGKYCSRKCQFKAQKNGKFVSCFICGSLTYKTQGNLRKSKSKKYFCNKSCQTIWRNQEFRGQRHGNWKGGEHIEYRKILIKNNVTPICKLCGCKDLRVLCVHHVDKNKRNNNIKNLMWVCHNCHYLIHGHKIEL